MFSLTIAFGPGPTVWRLMWNDEEAAKKAFGECATPMPAISTDFAEMLDLADDFGQQLRVERASVHGVLFEEIDKSKLAHIAAILHQERTQALARQAAANDPVLRNARFQQGPAVMVPQGMNGPMR